MAFHEVYIDKQIPLIVGSSDVGDTSVCGKNDNWCSLAFKSSVEEREALHIKHMDLVNEEHSRYDLGFALFSPF